MQVERAPVGASRRQRGGQRGRAVDDQKVAGLEHLGQVAERGVGERPAAAARHEQPDLVALEPARLGRLGGLEARRQREGGRRAHAAAPASSRAA
jgi:hypothetical protein